MSKTTKTVLIVLGVIVVIYFLFGRKKSQSIPANTDGTLDVATEKPVVENTVDPNAVNAAGQPIN